MKPHHLALALLIMAIWGFTFITARVGVTHFPPVFFTALRFGVVGIVLLPWLRIVPGRMRDILLIAVCAGALHFGLMYSGMALTGSVSSVAVLVQLGAPFSILLAVFWLKESVDARRIAGIVLALLGVLLLGFDPAVFNYPLGAALVIGGALIMSVAMILMRRLRGVGVFQLQAWIAAVSAPQLLLASLLFEQGQLREFADPTLIGLGAVAFTSLATSIVGHGGWYFLMQRYTIAQTAGFGLLPPVLAVAFGVILFNEPLTWKLIAAAILVTGGMAVITLRREPREKPATDQPAISAASIAAGE